MSTDTAAKFRDALVGLMAPDMNSTATALVDGFLNQSVRYNVSQPLNTAAATASTHTLDGSTLLQMRVKTFKVITHANVTADNTSYATIALVYNNGNGGSDTTIALGNTANAGAAGAPTGDITALIAYSFTCNATPVPAGNQLQVKITKVSSGVALPALSFEVKGVPV
jgi:hypothetical protein